jgi:hypothetical protein
MSTEILVFENQVAIMKALVWLIRPALKARGEALMTQNQLAEALMAQIQETRDFLQQMDKHP